MGVGYSASVVTFGHQILNGLQTGIIQILIIFSLKGEKKHEQKYWILGLLGFGAFWKSIFLIQNSLNTEKNCKNLQKKYIYKELAQKGW